MLTGSDLADAWEANRKELAGYSDKPLEKFVQDHPGLFAVIVATTAQTAAEFAPTVGAGFVDILNLGKGAAEGGWGYLQDGLRFVSAVTPMVRGGTAIVSRVLAMGGEGNCTWIAAAKALASTGVRPFALVGDLAKAAGIPASATSGAFIGDLLGALRALGARVRLLPNPTTMEEVVQAVRANRNGATVFSFQWNNAAFGGEVGHSLVAFWSNAKNAVLFADRYGKIVTGLTELESTYPGIAGATPYGTMAFIENTLIPQASLIPGFVASSIFDSLAIEVKLAFAPPPEIVEQARRRPMVTTGDPLISNLYTVVSGDWLSKIAQSFYSDMYLWPLIYEANKKTIGGNPDLIRPGMKLQIPQLDTVPADQTESARKRGRAWRRVH